MCDYHFTESTSSSKRAPANSSTDTPSLTLSHSAHPEVNSSKSGVGLQTLAIQAPSPHPGRKSVLSFKVPPVNNRFHQGKAVSTVSTKPLAVLKGNDVSTVSSSDDILSNPKRGFKEMVLEGLENTEPADGANEKKPQFFWEKTLMETRDEMNEKEQDANCKTQ